MRHSARWRNTISSVCRWSRTAGSSGFCRGPFCSDVLPRTSRRRYRTAADRSLKSLKRRSPVLDGGALPALPNRVPRAPEAGEGSLPTPRATVARRPFETGLAAGVRARRCRALFLFGQFGRGECRAIEDVALADLQPVESEIREHLARYDRATDDDGRAVRIERAHTASFV